MHRLVVETELCQLQQAAVADTIAFTGCFSTMPPAEREAILNSPPKF